jgi:hypothetical protein
MIRKPKCTRIVKPKLRGAKLAQNAGSGPVSDPDGVAPDRVKLGQKIESGPISDCVFTHKQDALVGGLAGAGSSRRDLALWLHLGRSRAARYAP